MDIPAKELASAIASLVPKPAPDWCLFWQFDWEVTCMSKAEWSGWMQALGAAVAIVAAFVVARYQYAQVERSRASRNKQLTVTIAIAIRDLYLATIDILEDLKSPEKNAYELNPSAYIRFIKDRFEPIRNIPFWDIDDPVAASLAMNVRSAIQGFDQVISDMPEKLVDATEFLSGQCLPYLQEFGTEMERSRKVSPPAKPVI